MLEIQGGAVTKAAARERKVPMLDLRRSQQTIPSKKSQAVNPAEPAPADGAFLLQATTKMNISVDMRNERKKSIGKLKKSDKKAQQNADMTELATVEQAGQMETDEIHENMHSIHYANIEREQTGAFRDESQVSSSLDFRGTGQTFRDATKFQGASGGATTVKLQTAKTDGKAMK